MRKKLIEVALPLEAINVASAREKSIRHGHPSTLHLWWARRPLAACRAVLFSQLVDDPSSWPEHFAGEERQEKERKRLFDLITDLVQWKNSNNDRIINAARVEIARSLARGRKADGEGTERDEAVLQVAAGFTGTGYRNLVPREVSLINSYLAEVAPPVHDPFAGGGSIPLEGQRLGLRAIATDLNPVAVLINKALIEIPPKFAGMPPVNPESRKTAGMRTWKGAQGLAEDVRYYGHWMRDEAYRRIGHLYPPVKVTEDMARDRPDLKPYTGQQLKVIAWLWARTVVSPNPACGGAHVPLISSFWLSKKTSKEAWIEDVVDRARNQWHFEVRRGKPTMPEIVAAGTKAGRGNFECVLSGDPMPGEYLRQDGGAGRMGLRLTAIVAEGRRERLYISAQKDHEVITAAHLSDQEGAPDSDLPGQALGFRIQNYGMKKHRDMFTGRQLAMLATLSGLVADARDAIGRDARISGPGSAIGSTDDIASVDGREDAIALYLALAVSKLSDYNSSLVLWSPSRDQAKTTFSRHALPMVWDFAEVSPFANAAGDLSVTLEGIERVLKGIDQRAPVGTVRQLDAARSDGLTDQTAILAGVLPLTDAAEAETLRDTFTDFRIPDEVIDRLKKAGDAEAEGMAIATEVINEIKKMDGVRGIHILSGGKEAIVPELVKAAGL